MADGYGFGGEGDWKTSALLPHPQGDGRGRCPAARRSWRTTPTTSCPGEELILGAHMLEVCPSIAVGAPLARDPPARHRRPRGPGPAGVRRRPRRRASWSAWPTWATGSASSPTRSRSSPRTSRCRSCRSPAPCGARRPTCARPTEALAAPPAGRTTRCCPPPLARRAPRGPRARWSAPSCVLIDADTTVRRLRRGAALEPGLPPAGRRASARHDDHRPPPAAPHGPVPTRSPHPEHHGEAHGSYPTAGSTQADQCADHSPRRGAAMAHRLAACGGATPAPAATRAPSASPCPRSPRSAGSPTATTSRSSSRRPATRSTCSTPRTTSRPRSPRSRTWSPRASTMLVVAAIDGTALGDVLDTAEGQRHPGDLLRPADPRHATRSTTTRPSTTSRSASSRRQSLVDGLKASGTAAVQRRAVRRLARRQQRHVLLERRHVGAPADDRLRRHGRRLRADHFDQAAILRWDPATAQKRMEDILTKSYTSKDGQRRALAVRRPLARHHRRAEGQRLRRPRQAAPGRDRSGRRGAVGQVDPRRGAVLDDLQGHPRAGRGHRRHGQGDRAGKKPEVNDTKTYDNGVKVVPSYLLDPVPVTKDNVQEALVDRATTPQAELK